MVSWASAVSRSATIPTPSLICSSNTPGQPTLLPPTDSPAFSVLQQNAPLKLTEQSRPEGLSEPPSSSNVTVDAYSNHGSYGDHDQDRDRNPSHGIQSVPAPPASRFVAPGIHHSPPLQPHSNPSPDHTRNLISTLRADPLLNADFTFASSRDQNGDSESRQCDSGPNTRPLPVLVPLYSAARHCQEEQFKEDQHLFVSSFALIEDPSPSLADDDTDSSSGDGPFGDIGPAISLKRQIFVKKGLLNNAPLVDSIDELLPEEDIEEIEEVHGLTVISNDDIQEENPVKMLEEEEKVTLALSDSPSFELDLECLGKSRSQILKHKFSMTRAELPDENWIWKIDDEFVVGSGIANLFPAGVEMQDLNFTEKADPIERSQVVRQNASEGFNPKFVINGDEFNVTHGDSECRSQAAHSQRQRGENFAIAEVCSVARDMDYRMRIDDISSMFTASVLDYAVSSSLAAESFLGTEAIETGKRSSSYFCDDVVNKRARQDNEAGKSKQLHENSFFSIPPEGKLPEEAEWTRVATVVDANDKSFETGYEFDHRITGLDQLEDIYFEFSNHSHWRHVPVRPAHQADLPKWITWDSNIASDNGPTSYADNHDEASADKWLGTCVMPMPDRDSIAKDVLRCYSKIVCDCTDEGSINCVRKHVMEARENLVRVLEQEELIQMGFSHRGEKVPYILWEDANLHLRNEVECWPYAFPLSEYYLKAEERSSVTDRLLICDRYIDAQVLYASSSYIGLAISEEVGSWQTECMGYLFLMRAEAVGLFSIKNIHTRCYDLFAWAPRYDTTIAILSGRSKILVTTRMDPAVEFYILEMLVQFNAFQVEPPHVDWGKPHHVVILKPTIKIFDPGGSLFPFERHASTESRLFVARGV